MGDVHLGDANLDDVKTRGGTGPHPVWLVVGPWAMFAVVVGGFLARWWP
ncbi:hypothetical protein [Methylobacterium indicum]|nr:hypothetical protein [Methylobacterium indicum]